jgi:hypothetical protein
LVDGSTASPSSSAFELSFSSASAIASWSISYSAAYSTGFSGSFSTVAKSAFESFETAVFAAASKVYVMGLDTDLDFSKAETAWIVLAADFNPFLPLLKVPPFFPFLAAAFSAFFLALIRFLYLYTLHANLILI